MFYNTHEEKEMQIDPSENTPMVSLSGDVITIADIRSYYKERLDGLQREIDEENGLPSVTEAFLLAKFKCELGYCHKAIIKTGVGVFKGVHDLVRQADDDIEAFRMMESGQVTVNS